MLFDNFVEYDDMADTARGYMGQLSSKQLQEAWRCAPFPELDQFF